MSSANISSGPANCMKFNSSFLFYIGFFLLLVIGYMWGKRNGTKEERNKGSNSGTKVSKVAAVASKVSKAGSKIGSKIKSIGKKKK